MRSKLLLVFAFCLSVLAFSTSCTKEESAPDTLVNSAISINAELVKSSSITVSCSSKQSNVVSYLIAPPVLKSEAKLDEMDAVARYNFIKERASQTESSATFNKLTPKNSYVIGAMGLDQAGNVVSAPTFLNFETTDVTIFLETSCDKVEGEDGEMQYTYNASITLDPSAVSFRYLYGMEFSALTNDELKAKILDMNDADVKEATEFVVSDPTKVKGIAVLAAIPYNEEGVAGSLFVAYASAYPLVTVKTPSVTKLDQPNLEEDIFEGIVDVAAEGNFVFTIDEVEYGFTSRTGNGGLGLVEDVSNTAIKHAKKYTVSKSVGRMTTIEEGGNKFWLNMEEPAKMYVRVDLTYGDGIPRYYIKKVETDPNVIFHENFDLFTYACDYMLRLDGYDVTSDIGKDSGSKTANPDGTEEATKTVAAGGSYAYGTMLYSHNASGNNYTFTTDTYFRNRDVQDWTLVNCAEQVGMLVLGNSGTSGVATTPAMGQAANKATVTMEIGRLGGNVGMLTFRVEHGGKFTSVKSTKVNYGDSTSAEFGSSDLSTAEFIIDTNYYSALPSGGKAITHVLTFTVEGLTSETKFTLDCNPVAPETSRANTRTLLLDFKVTKTE